MISSAIDVDDQAVDDRQEVTLGSAARLLAAVMGLLVGPSFAAACGDGSSPATPTPAVRSVDDYAAYLCPLFKKLRTAMPSTDANAEQVMSKVPVARMTLVEAQQELERLVLPDSQLREWNQLLIKDLEASERVMRVAEEQGWQAAQDAYQQADREDEQMPSELAQALERAGCAS